MNERLSKLREMTLLRKFQDLRLEAVPEQTGDFVSKCASEKPIVLIDERIVFMRSRNKPTDSQRNRYKDIIRIFRKIKSLVRRVQNSIFTSLSKSSKRTLYRSIYNATPDYTLLLKYGLKARIAASKSDQARREMTALLDLTRRYAEEARRVGNLEMYDVLSRVPAEAPQTFHEALQSLRILQYGFYLYGMAHCGWGRMDQYLIDFYRADLIAGRLTREEAKELLEEFFIAMNRDADLYPGVQQGDNGQSLMLGGCKPEDGSSAVNELTYLIIEAVLETRLIDPKINLRVDSNTPTDLLELGSELTKCGLGFPQYSNDEVVIPALVKHGYKLEDARNYSVAACWEFIIPGKGMDMVNIAALSFPYAVDKALRDEVAGGTFSSESFKRRIAEDIDRQVAKIIDFDREVWSNEPMLHEFFPNIVYNNIGIHGAGSANAADAMSAVSKIYGEGGLEGLKKLVNAQDENFSNSADLRRQLIDDMPKIGNADPEADANLKFLFDCFADIAEKYSKPNRIIRPGTGSAMYYIWLTDTKSPRVKCMKEPIVGATSDGRFLDAPLGSSLAPAQDAKVNGVLSVLKSFATIDYSRIMNGGPITIEFSNTIFKTPEGVKKLAQLIKYFVALGNQQLQLNVLDIEELENALVHPERHRNLVVRVWGWSGYFCELDSEFQRQIIRRHRYGI